MKDCSQAVESNAPCYSQLATSDDYRGVLSWINSSLAFRKPSRRVSTCSSRKSTRWINLVVLLTESSILKYISPDIINVAERILGLLLAALAVQTVLNALQALGLIVIKTGAH